MQQKQGQGQRKYALAYVHGRTHAHSWYAKEEVRDVGRDCDRTVMEKQQGRLGWGDCDKQGREANLWEVTEAEAKNRQIESSLPEVGGAWCVLEHSRKPRWKGKWVWVRLGDMQ